MDFRKAIQEKPVIGIVMAVFLLMLAGMILAHQYWPQKQANLSMTFFTDDDGQTWFVDSTVNVPPFDHNGKTAVFADIYSYDNGSKKFCAYLSKYTPEAKKALDAALTEAQKNGQPLASVPLYHDAVFMKKAVLVKPTGPGGKWVSMSDPQSISITTLHSPDGSAPDECFVY